MARIAIIGLGLIGASIGLALKRNARADMEIVGCDRDPANANAARKRGAVDRTESAAADAVRDADVVIVATPIIAVRPVFRDIAAALRPGVVVTDTASVKAPILAAATQLLPEQAHFIGGHPMAGSDRSGPEAASATLFVDDAGRGRPYCVVPSPRASEQAVSAVLGLIQMLGAEPVFIDADEHDALVAAVSHMPLLLSVALFTMARRSPAWEDLAPLAGPAFRDLTRLAKGNPEMALDILGTNRENVLHWLDRLQDEIQRYRDLLKGEERAVHEELVRAQIDREVFEGGPPQRGQPGSGPAIPSASDQFMSMIVGERLVQRGRDLANLNETDPLERRLRDRARERERAEGEE